MNWIADSLCFVICFVLFVVRCIEDVKFELMVFVHFRTTVFRSVVEERTVQ